MESGLVLARLSTGESTTVISAWTEDLRHAKIQAVGAYSSGAPGSAVVMSAWWRGDESLQGVLVDEDNIVTAVLNRWVGPAIPLQWVAASSAGAVAWWIADESDPAASELLPRVPVLVRTHPDGAQQAALDPWELWLDPATLTMGHPGDENVPPTWYIVGENGGGISVLRLGPSTP